ncbi:MAG: hypothetical protein COB53_03470 [Elusimicrobia bacterium]|nr:MAG: hypothetical protein COB53_03470 [Elusimicrobiota bacterium]
MAPSFPTPPKERTLSIDALHGFGLLGVFLLDMPMFVRPVWGEFFPLLHPSETGSSAVVRILLTTFVHTKFFTIFALLFGTSLALLFERAENTDTDAELAYFRRMTALFLIGIAVGVFAWYTNVLLILAVCGALAVPTARWEAPRVLRGSWRILAIGAALGAFAIAGGAVTGGASEMFVTRVAYLAGHEHAVFSVWNFQELTAYRGALFLTLIPPTFLLFGGKILGCVMLGVWLQKTRSFQHSEQSQAFWKRILVWGGALGLPSQFLAAMLAHFYPVSPLSAGAQWLLLYFGGLALAGAYIAIICLLAANDRWTRLLSPAAAMGRMGLSNYCLGITLASLIAYPYGLGYFGKLSTASSAAVAIPLWIVCLGCSYFWLLWFRFGPLEWLVRGFAYGRLPKMSVNSS